MEIKELHDIFLSSAGVTTDSRQIKGGELFIALKGENSDGNAYAHKALEAGAAYAVVDEDSTAAKSGSDKIIPVQDGLKTLMALARYHREHEIRDGRPITVIGLTGSNGKTTTKELVKAVLSVKYRVTATEGNLNNDIGVPLSLLKINKDTDIAVIEMGASHPDDISRLVRIAEPTCGLITNVGKAHLLGFGSFEGVKAAKGELYDFFLENGGYVFVNQDDSVLMEMLHDREDLPAMYYGMQPDWQILPSDSGHPYLRIKTDKLTIETNLVGTYNVANVLAAIRIGERFGISPEDGAKAIAAYVPSNNRSQLVETGHNSLIVDAYNANPSSMGAALDNFCNIVSDHKAVMLGDMRELGEDSVKEHVKVVERLKDLDIKAFLVGEEFGKAMGECDIPLMEGVESGKAEFYWSPDSDALCDFIKENPFNGYTILVKGSHSMSMEKSVAVL